MLYSGVFAGTPMSETEEMNNLADALYNGDTMVVDEYGVVHLDDGTSTSENGARISDGSFAGTPMSETEEMNNLADALYNGDTMVVDEYGVVHLDDGTSTSENGARISDGSFAGEPLTENQEIELLADAVFDEDELSVDGEGIVHLDDGTNTSDNGPRISEGSFAAAAMPGDPTQWYNKNDHRLFRTEVAAMKKMFPKAGFGFMKSTGNMYWVIDMKISQTGFSNTWRFMLVYDKDHPHNHTYGGSIKVFPIKPNANELRQIATRNGRPGVPHLLKDDNLGTYLCTRRTEDVEDGTHAANSAVSVAAWAADWALHFEIGMRSKKVWNKWCDDKHFRNLMLK